MTRPFTIGAMFCGNLRLHWSWPIVPIGVATYSLAVHPWTEAALYVLVLLSIYLCVLVHQAVEFLAARKCGLGIRDVTLYPFWGVARFARIGERPAQEKSVASAGLMILGLLVAAVGCAVVMVAGGIAFPGETAEWTADTFLLRMFWALVLLTIAHLLPILPFDGGRILRASLAMRTSRLRATETTAHLSTIGAGLLLVVAVLWLKSPMLGLTAVLIFLAAQEELDTTRYFERLRRVPERRRPAAMAPIDQIVTSDCRPVEADFTGFTWNADAGLWIEWRAGRPVAANALIGDGRS